MAARTQRKLTENKRILFQKIASIELIYWKKVNDIVREGYLSKTTFESLACLLKLKKLLINYIKIPLGSKLFLTS